MSSEKENEVSPLVTNTQSEDIDRLPCIGIEIQPPYTKFNLLTFFYASFASIGSLVFMNAALPYVLENYLGIPKDNQGNAVGDILLVNEIIVIVTITMWGMLSDKIGRKFIYILGFSLMGLSMFLTPFSQSLLAVILFRVPFALGASASSVMLTALLADYPLDKGLGKSGGVIGLMAGLGALCSLFGFLGIPSMVNSPSVYTNGDIMYWVVAGWIFISAIVLLIGLSDKKSNYTKHNNFFIIIKDGINAASNPRILLAYLSSFAARGDATVITSFLSLWVYQYELSKGVSNQDALRQGGVISGIAQTLAIVGAPLFGLLAEYIDRVWAQTIAAGIAMAGYMFVFFLDDPTGWPIYLAVVLVGIGEIGMIICSQVLLATGAPPHVRGSVSGCFGLAGSISILVVTKLGGVLFDSWTNTAPFFILGIVNGLVFIFALILSILERIRNRNQNLTLV